MWLASLSDHPPLIQGFRLCFLKIFLVSSCLAQTVRSIALWTKWLIGMRYKIFYRRQISSNNFKLVALLQLLWMKKITMLIKEPLKPEICELELTLSVVKMTWKDHNNWRRVLQMGNLVFTSRCRQGLWPFQLSTSLPVGSSLTVQSPYK